MAKHSLSADPEDEDCDRTGAKRKKAGNDDASRAHYGNIGPRRRHDGKDLGSGRYAGSKVSRRMLENKEDGRNDNGVECVEHEYIDSRAADPDCNILSPELVRELKELERNESAQIELIQRNSIADSQKSQHVRNQLKLWTEVLNVRVKMQPLLVLAAKLPRAEIVNPCGGEETEIAGALDILLSCQRSVMKNDGIAFEECNDRWEQICALDAALMPVCQEAMEAWQQRITLSADNVRKRLRTINASPWVQVQSALSAHMAHLIQKTHHQDRPDTFMDTDFYQNHLLKEWLLANPVPPGESIVVGFARTQGPSNRNTAKGYGMRFDVQTRLVNYMVPRKHGSEWTEEKTDELFSCLLGK